VSNETESPYRVTKRESLPDLKSVATITIAETIVDGKSQMEVRMIGTGESEAIAESMVEILVACIEHEAPESKREAVQS